ncbi:MAG: GNAT family N-acetyltransferase [Aggregatilineales bacterium]
MDTEISVKPLRGEDAEVFRALRLRSLQEHPEAFGASYEEEVTRSVEDFAEMLNGSNAFFGAFLDGVMVGMVNVARHPRTKTVHRAHINGMYVAPEARGKQGGKALLDTALAFCRASEGVEHVVLAVTATNVAARSLYRKAGFMTWGMDPNYLKIDGTYYDIEWMVLNII